MEFEWDPRKAIRNLAKHGVSFAEAATIFGDPRAITFMKKKDDLAEADDDVRSEYDASVLTGGVRGKHLDRYRSGTNLALLAPEVRAAFPTDESVNQALRSLMHGRSPA